MEPIAVPSPPKAAFNKHRPMSDLIKKQVEHFKHVEERLPAEVRSTLPKHAIRTEDDAARYIAPMTRLLLSRQAKAAPKGLLVMPSPAVEETVFALAAEADEQPAPKKSTSRTGRRSSGAPKEKQ